MIRIYFVLLLITNTYVKSMNDHQQQQLVWVDEEDLRGVRDARSRNCLKSNALSAAYAFVLPPNLALAFMCEKYSDNLALQLGGYVPVVALFAHGVSHGIGIQKKANLDDCICNILSGLGGFFVSLVLMDIIYAS